MLAGFRKGNAAGLLLVILSQEVAAILVCAGGPP